MVSTFSTCVAASLIPAVKIPDILRLLEGQREELLAHQRQIAETIERLNYKVSRYGVAEESGGLSWE